MNRLYYGDNLDVLRRHIEDESVDLVYLETLGHSQISQPLNTYSHVLPSLQRDAAEKMNRLLVG